MHSSVFSAAGFRRHAHAWGYVVVAVAMLGLLVAFLSGPLFHPNDHYFMRGGDGIQSYFATSFYALYDQGVRFSGMNYPYGEHINYPNLQPLLAWSIGSFIINEKFFLSKQDTEIMFFVNAGT